MRDAIIVANAGSASLKFSAYAVVDQGSNLVARGRIEGLGTSPRFRNRDGQGQVPAEAKPEPGSGRFEHTAGFACLAHWLRTQFGKRLTPKAVGHRMAHGGLDFIEPTLINAEVIAIIAELTSAVIQARSSPGQG